MEIYYVQFQITIIGLYLVNTKTNRLNEIKISNTDSTDFLFDLVSIGNDNYLVAGLKGLAQYDLKSNKIIWYDLGKPTSVLSILKADNDHLWLGTFNKGLLNYNLKDRTYEAFPSFKKLLNDEGDLIIGEIIFDQRKNLL